MRKQCELLGVARSTVDYQATPEDPEAIRSIMGLCQLAEKRRASAVNAACAKAMDAAANLPSFRTIKHLLEAGDQAPGQIQMELRETDPIIRPLTRASRRRPSACIART